MVCLQNGFAILLTIKIAFWGYTQCTLQTPNTPTKNPSQQESKVKGRTHMCLVRCFADWTFDSSPARGGEQPENLRGDEVGGLLYLSIFGSDNFDPSKPGMSSLLKPSPGVGTDVPIAKLNIVYGYVVSAFCIPASYSAESVRVPRLHQLWIPNSVSKNESVVQKVEKTHPNVLQIYGGFRKLGYPKMNGL